MRKASAVSLTPALEPPQVKTETIAANSCISESGNYHFQCDIFKGKRINIAAVDDADADADAMSENGASASFSVGRSKYNLNHYDEAIGLSASGNSNSNEEDYDLTSSEGLINYVD